MIKRLSVRIIVLSSITLNLFAATMAPAQAGKIEPMPVSCWFLHGENVQLNQTCTYESVSWSGGGLMSLTWEDGVKTGMTWGVQGRGGRPCEETALDGVCGSDYIRDPKSFRELPREQGEQRRLEGQKSVRCVEVKQNSVCWMPPY
jgi:hypothetical protein